MSLAVGFLVGAVLGACAVPLVRWLPRGIDERLEQPRWTRLAGHPATLVVAGALLGGLIAAGAPSWPALASGLVLLAVLLPATAIDVAWRVVPDSLVAFGFVVGLAGLRAARRALRLDFGFSASPLRYSLAAFSVRKHTECRFPPVNFLPSLP